MRSKKLLLITAFILFSFFTTNIYSQWLPSGSVPALGTYPGICVVNPNVAWICSGQNTPQVFRTTNGGLNWVSIPITGLPVKALMCIWATDSMTCYVADGGDAAGTTGGDASISKTTNGGVTWTTIYNTGGTAGFFNGVVFSRMNPNVGFAESDPPLGAGQPYYILKTTNNGMNWTLTNPPGIPGNASAQNSLMMVDDQFYGFGLNAAAGVYITSNGGTNWTQRTLGLAGTFTSALAFNDNKTIGVASTSTSFPSIARTTNGGVTWSSISLGGSGTATNSALKWISGTNTVYFLAQNASSGIIYKSTNGGLNWSAMINPTPNLFHFDFVRNGITVTGYAVSVGGLITKLTDVVTEVPQITGNLPTNFNLKQNYPNPFNPVTNISFALPKAGKVTLQIYNVMGQLIHTAYNNSQFNAGEFSYKFDGSNLSSGIYTYKLSVDGNEIAAKRMMLVK